MVVVNYNQCQGESLEKIRRKPKMEAESEIRVRQLKDYFWRHGRGIVAYSGGVDSTLLAYVAHLALEDKMVAALADSPSLSRREYRSALNFVGIHGIPLQIIRTQEMEDSRYLANPANRCYYCKKELFKKIEILVRQLERTGGGLSWPIFYGVNLDDLGDFRPGIQAAREASILAPYVELGFDKNAIRRICDHLGLEISQKPAMPCLSSRIQYGQRVSPEKLRQVEKAEDFLYDLGFRVLRVRHHGETARIEIPPQDFKALVEHKEKISQKFHALGFIYVTLDLDGFKSGSLNAVLKSKGDEG
jgi:uncharacterized protein